MRISVKRVYASVSDEDGYRVLVDRLWPRGIKKEEAAIDLWRKEIAPSAELRKWFGHDPLKFDEFRRRYIKELEQNPDMEQFVKVLQHSGRAITLLYGAKDELHNQAVILKEYLDALE